MTRASTHPSLWLVIVALLVATAAAAQTDAPTEQTATPADAATSTDAATPACQTVFSHRVHAEAGSCGDCHTDVADVARPAQLGRATCAMCHETDEPGFCFDPGPEKPGYVVALSHARHLAIDPAPDCTRCHALKNGEPRRFPTAKTCESCHAKPMKTLGNCAICHGEAALIPENHTVGWQRRHGRYATQRIISAHGQSCESCHRQSVCNSCHTSEQPRDHTGFFKLRGHGMKATVDRTRCETCHRADSCRACHLTTKPITHRGNWRLLHGRSLPGGKGGPIGNCGVCHSQAWCAACHLNLP